jgi:cytochrome c
MKAKGGKWTFEELDKFLTHPQGYIPGTKMTFAGFQKPTQRANLIAYLRTLSDNPVPLPNATATAPPGGNAQNPAQQNPPQKAKAGG